jgi:hypothetical protein
MAHIDLAETTRKAHNQKIKETIKPGTRRDKESEANPILNSENIFLYCKPDHAYKD